MLFAGCEGARLCSRRPRASQSSRLPSLLLLASCWCSGSQASAKMEPWCWPSMDAPGTSRTLDAAPAGNAAALSRTPGPAFTTGS